MIFVDGLVSNNALLQLLVLDFWIGIQKYTPKPHTEERGRKE